MNTLLHWFFSNKWREWEMRLQKIRVSMGWTVFSVKLLETWLINWRRSWWMEAEGETGYVFDTPKRVSLNELHINCRDVSGVTHTQQQYSYSQIYKTLPSQTKSTQTHQFFTVLWGDWVKEELAVMMMMIARCVSGKQELESMSLLVGS